MRSAIRMTKAIIIVRMQRSLPPLRSGLSTERVPSPFRHGAPTILMNTRESCQTPTRWPELLDLARCRRYIKCTEAPPASIVWLFHNACYGVLPTNQWVIPDGRIRQLHGPVAEPSNNPGLQSHTVTGQGRDG